MKRDLHRLAAHEHDVLIIGGGIHGAALAHACVGLGMQVALVEQGDFGHATSANSLKIMHGGLRYLQHLNLRRMRESILARRDLLSFAPDYVKPLPCLIPNYGNGLRGNMLMRIALRLNDLIGWDRNRGVSASRRLPPGKIIPRSEAKRLFAGISSGEPTGASLWYDALAVNTERLTLSFILAAVDLGAQVANHAEAIEIVVAENRVTGVVVLDRENDRKLTIPARTVVNAAGPWLDRAMRPVESCRSSRCNWAKAVNIVVKKSFWEPYAVGLTGEPEFSDRDAVLKKKGRFFFFVPWRGYTMIGTSYKSFAGTPGELRPEMADIEELLREVNRMYPSAALTSADVTRVHVGLVPMLGDNDAPNREVQLVKESEIIACGAGGLFAIKGVKYTTAPKVAQSAGKLLGRYLSRAYGWRPDRTGRQAKTATAAGVGETLPGPYRFLEDRYGPRAGLVYGYILSNDRCISEDPPLYLGEIDYFLAEEMALTLSDVVFRRCELASAECPDEETLSVIARHMAEARHWNETRFHDEIRAVQKTFAPLPVTMS